MRNPRVSLLACGFVYALIAGPPEARAAADSGTRCQARKRRRFIRASLSTETPCGIGRRGFEALSALGTTRI